MPNLRGTTDLARGRTDLVGGATDLDTGGAMNDRTVARRVPSAT
jgi:hypothetical protein